MKPNIETFIGCDNSYEESKIVLFGAPFDSTTSFRPGTRFLPAKQCEVNHSALKLTVRIRMEI